jgi:hypothetical protein
MEPALRKNVRRPACSTRRKENHRGQVLLEFSLVLPVYLLFLLALPVINDVALVRRKAELAARYLAWLPPKAPLPAPEELREVQFGELPVEELRYEVAPLPADRSVLNETKTRAPTAEASALLDDLLTRLLDTRQATLTLRIPTLHEAIPPLEVSAEHTVDRTGAVVATAQKLKERFRMSAPPILRTTP